MKTEKICLILIAIIVFMSSIAISCIAIYQVINKNYLEAVVIGIMALMFLALAVAIIIISLEGDNDGI